VQYRAEKVGALRELIQINVLCDSWAPLGAASVTEFDGLLVVNQSVSGHRQLAKLLSELRQHPPAHCGPHVANAMLVQTPGRPAPQLPDAGLAAYSKRFVVAFSFPDERRTFVAQVAECVSGKIGQDRVLYDKYYEAEFARPGLDTYLQRLYHDESAMNAVFLCADYERKEWCGLEWRAIRDLIKNRQDSSVMLFRFDNTVIPGLFSIDGYVWVGDRTPQDVGELILRRIQDNAGHS
jgi:hypothetical protein